MDGSEPSRSTRGAPTRVSLACIPCRTRHVRCDASQPTCARCSEEGRQCHYAKSRRGGLDRATLAARRGLTGTAPAPRPSCPAMIVENREQLNPLPLGNSPPSLTEAAGPSDPQDEWLPGLSRLQLAGFASDPFIDSYYASFHRFHPYILPRKHLERIYRDPAKQLRLQPLISAMRFVGSLYARSHQSSRLKAAMVQAIDEASRQPPDPFRVQSYLLSAIALFWYGDEARSQRAMDSAIDTAVDLAMFHRHFAAEHGDGDSVLQESWRRTWWQIYITDAFIAATTREFTFRTYYIDATTELPCEEEEYEAGAIPVPKSLDEFNSREFSSDDHRFSSFAYLIGAIRGIANSIPSSITDDPSPQALEEVDAVVDGWLLLLPESKKRTLCADGEIDELMFQANMALHTSILGLHRPFSALLSNPMECISSCARATPEDRPSQDAQALHTMRCLRSIEAQVRLLALPAHSFCHSPFAVCMVTTGTIPLLSACKLLFTGKKLATARNQIRLSIGCLKSFAQVWPRGAKILLETQTIAREVLKIAPREESGITGPASDTSATAAASDPSSRGDLTDGSGDFSLHFPLLDDSQTCWDPNDTQNDLSLWLPYG